MSNFYFDKSTYFSMIILTGTPLATISGIFSAQMVSSPALSADPKDEVEEW